MTEKVFESKDLFVFLPFGIVCFYIGYFWCKRKLYRRIRGMK